MARPHGVTPDGRPANLIGQPLEVRPAPAPALRITRVEDDAMAKAEKTGVYTLNGYRYRINAGDVLPEGAEMAQDAPEERKRVETPENRAKAAAPENRADKKAEK
jgi:hypothetical protein